MYDFDNIGIALSCISVFWEIINLGAWDEIVMQEQVSSSYIMTHYDVRPFDYFDNFLNVGYVHKIINIFINLFNGLHYLIA